VAKKLNCEQKKVLRNSKEKNDVSYDVCCNFCPLFFGHGTKRVLKSILYFSFLNMTLKHYDKLSENEHIRETRESICVQERNRN